MTLASIRKALTPAVLNIVAVVTDWIASGALDGDALRIAISGLVTSVAVYIVPNEPSTTYRGP